MSQDSGITSVNSLQVIPEMIGGSLERRKSKTKGNKTEGLGTFT